MLKPETLEAIKKHIYKMSGKGKSTYINEPGLHCSELHALYLLLDHITEMYKKEDHLKCKS